MTDVAEVAVDGLEALRQSEDVRHWTLRTSDIETTLRSCQGAVLAGLAAVVVDSRELLLARRLLPDEIAVATHLHEVRAPDRVTVVCWRSATTMGDSQ